MRGCHALLENSLLSSPAPHSFPTTFDAVQPQLQFFERQGNWASGSANGNGFLKECLASSKGSSHRKSKESPDDLFPMFLVSPHIYKQDSSKWIKI